VNGETENVQEELRSVSKHDKEKGCPLEGTEQIFSYDFDSCTAFVLPQHGIKRNSVD
jgi:hypothetical protein